MDKNQKPTDPEKKSEEDIEEKIEATVAAGEKNSAAPEIVKIVCSRENLCWKPELDTKQVKVFDSGNIDNNINTDLLKFHCVAVIINKKKYCFFYHRNNSEDHYVKYNEENKTLGLSTEKLDIKSIGDDHVPTHPCSFTLNADTDQSSSGLMKGVKASPDGEIFEKWVVWSRNGIVHCADTLKETDKKACWEIKAQDD